MLKKLHHLIFLALMTLMVNGQNEVGEPKPAEPSFRQEHHDSYDIKCYQCDSSKDEYCPETWDRSDIEPTSCDHIDYPAFCVKTTGIYGAIVGTRRFCSSRNMDNACQEVYFPQDPRIYYSCIYTCTTDGCNESTRSTNVNKKILFLLSALASFFILLL